MCYKKWDPIRQDSKEFHAVFFCVFPKIQHSIAHRISYKTRTSTPLSLAPMANKKRNKKGSKKSKADLSNGMDILLPEDKIKHLEAQMQSLELQLTHRVESSVATTMEYTATKESLAGALNKYEEEKQLTIALTRDMTRQYKGMQDNLLNKINDREGIIQELTDTFSKTNTQNEVELEEKDSILRQKESYISEQKEKMEEMCDEFASMLRKAMQQLVDQIENNDYSQKKVPIQQLMSAEEYDYKFIMQ